MSSIHYSLALKLCDIRGWGLWGVTGDPQYFYYLFPEHDTLIAQKTSIQRVIPWHLPCSGKRQNKARCVPTTGIFDKYLSLIDTCQFVGMVHVHKLLTCRFPTGLWYRRYLKGDLCVDITNPLGSLCSAQLLAHLSKTAVEETRLSVPLARQKWDK